MVESEKHKLLKEFAKYLLAHYYRVPEEYIFEEFPIGNKRVDVIAYPTIDLGQQTGTHYSVIGIECGNVKSNVKANYLRFKELLHFMDFVLWIPYSLVNGLGHNLVSSSVNEVIFATSGLECPEEKYRELINSIKNEIAFYIVTKVGRHPQIEKYFPPARHYTFHEVQ